MEGCRDGFDVGWRDGWRLGCLVGCRVGEPDGCPVGGRIGALLGSGSASSCTPIILDFVVVVSTISRKYLNGPLSLPYPTEVLPELVFRVS